MRGLDRVHSTGELRRRTTVDLARGLHPVLHTIGWAGPIRTTELADALALDSSTVSRHVARLEQQGLVERVDDELDRRASRLVLSREGRRMTEALADGWEEILTEQLSNIGESDSRVLVAEILKLVGALDPLRPALPDAQVDRSKRS